MLITEEHIRRVLCINYEGLDMESTMHQQERNRKGYFYVLIIEEHIRRVLYVNYEGTDMAITMH